MIRFICTRRTSESSDIAQPRRIFYSFSFTTLRAQLACHYAPGSPPLLPCSYLEILLSEWLKNRAPKASQNSSHHFVTINGTRLIYFSIKHISTFVPSRISEDRCFIVAIWSIVSTLSSRELGAHTAEYSRMVELFSYHYPKDFIFTLFDGPYTILQSIFFRRARKVIYPPLDHTCSLLQLLQIL